MKRPFVLPGMDPYFEEESIWPAFHHLFVQTMSAILMKHLNPSYRLRVEERRYPCEGGSNSRDEQGEHVEEFIEIVDSNDDNVVTLIDFATPANKTEKSGRESYHQTRKTALDAGASAVEIDLVLQGKPLLDFSRDGLPEWDYAVTVQRGTQPGRYEIYTSTLEKRLPRFKIPMSAIDRDQVHDLQQTFNLVDEQSSFSIDYSRLPNVNLNQDQLMRIAAILRKDIGELLGLTHEELAIEAYFVWLEEGCPFAHEKQHWFRAIERLHQRNRQKVQLAK